MKAGELLSDPRVWAMLRRGQIELNRKTVRNFAAAMTERARVMDELKVRGLCAFVALKLYPRHEPPKKQ